MPDIVHTEAKTEKEDVIAEKTTTALTIMKSSNDDLDTNSVQSSSGGAHDDQRTMKHAHKMNVGDGDNDGIVERHLHEVNKTRNDTEVDENNEQAKKLAAVDAIFAAGTFVCVFCFHIACFVLLAWSYIYEQ